MSTSPAPIPTEPGASSSTGVEATAEVQATSTLPQEGVNATEAQSDDEDDDDEDAPPRPRLAFPPRPEGSATLVPTVHAEEDEDSDEDGLADLARQDQDSDSDSGDDDADAGGAYVPATENSAAKIPKFRKNKSKKNRDEDEVGTNGEKKQKRKEKKEKVKIKAPRQDKRDSEQPDGGDADEDEDMEPQYDEATQRRMALEQRIDAIGKPERKIKRKRKDEEDVADMYHEEVCNRLRERMERAAEKDRVSHEARLPATAKLAMLEDVMAVLRNVRMWQAIVDSRLLEAVSTWLEPIRPSGTLPAEGIQKAFFEVLPRMDIDAQTLKESYLGRVVLFYTKAPRVQGPIKRQADNLVQAWSRPILGRSSDMRNRKVPNIKDLDLTAAAEDIDMAGGGGGEDQEGGAGQSQSQSQGLSQSQRGSQGQKTRKKRVDWNERAEINTTAKGARLEKASDFQYEIAPEPQHKGKDRERDEHMRRIQMDNSRFNKFARQMRGGKAGGRG